MLIIGREIGQSVIIGNEVKVTISQIGSKLRLTVEAPNHIRVQRVKQHSNCTRKLKKGARIIGDTLLIGEDIKVTLFQTKCGLFRFAIDAPKEITIFREELYKAILQTENQKVPTL
ncbi:carbon storage regulator [Neobacillus thermocopriae]|uniref:carbon storage regulator n=1 Tax=Neobacillus thermocopriae TaxID=1215031 RepID=UPI002E1D9888|nr:carbon storage regulator [Neobacillus thermocopriae]MED3624016.1 carbon storage regulator [Neobacillus thermocopriae]MED3713789.1 carbon storage regulator [Neobacillus thermocopriae]